MFINEDLPTLDLPIKAYSGIDSLGHLETSVLLIINSADRIFIGINLFSYLKKEDNKPLIIDINSLPFRKSEGWVITFL